MPAWPVSNVPCMVHACVQELASSLLSAAAELAQRQSLPSRQRFNMCRALILTQLRQGRRAARTALLAACTALLAACTAFPGPLVICELHHGTCCGLDQAGVSTLIHLCPCRLWLEAQDADALGLLNSAHQLITGHLVRQLACMHAPRSLQGSGLQALQQLVQTADAPAGAGGGRP